MLGGIIFFVKTPAKLLLSLFLLCIVCSAQIEKIKPEWATFSSPLEWESPPPELQAEFKSAPARIRVFFPDGLYGQVGCYIIRQANGSVSISRGDGEVVRVGRWQQDGNQLVVSSRVVYRTVDLPETPIPEPEIVERFNFKRNQYWTLWNDKERYAPLQHFEDWGYLTDLIRCDREYFDGRKHYDGEQPCMPNPR